MTQQTLPTGTDRRTGEGHSPSPRHARTRGSGRGDRTAETQTHFLDYVADFHRHRVLAVSVFLLVMLAAAVHTYTTVPMYRAQARLIIEVEDQETTALAGVMRGANEYDPEPYYQTQYRILSGREMARRTANAIGVTRTAEVTRSAEHPSGLSRVIEAARRAVGAASPPAPQGIDESATAAALQTAVSVEPVKGSRLVDVAFVAADAAFAAEAVNTLVREYVNQNKEVRGLNVTSSLEWLSGELVRQKAKVEASEQALASYREDQNAISLEDRQNIVVARLNQLNDASTRARTNRVQKESLYDQVKSIAASDSAAAVPAILGNTYLQAVKTQLSDLERERANLAERYGSRHPEMIRINAAIADASRQLEIETSKAVDGIRNDYLAALAEERSLDASLEEQKAAAMNLGRQSVSYSVLEREAQSNRQVYESLLQREKELQVMVNSRGNNVRIMEEAETPGQPYTPRVRRNFSLGALIGLILAAGLVLTLTYLDDTVKTPEDVINKVRVPFLGMVPKTAGTEQPLLSGSVPHAFGEAFRSLRTSLMFSNGSTGHRVIMLTSAQPLEGKTTTACNLAQALALSGERVLLIDADMRRPGVPRVLGLEQKAGLSQVLTGRAASADAVQLVAQNFWVMTSGDLPPNPSELLATDAMHGLLTGMQDTYDWVIVDTPPVLAVTDAVILAPLASGVVFVVRSEMTPKRHVTQALDTLMNGHPRLLGVVLNSVDLERNKYYYSRYYGYEHTYSYGATT